MDRRTLGGWLEGPGAGVPDTTQAYRGERLGLPADGVGSLGGVGRRLAAITIDWFAAILVARLIFPSVRYGTHDSPRLVLLTFAFMVALLVWLGGATLGQRLLSLQVVRLGGRRVGVGSALLRTVLLCLVIPAVIWDRDQRGLHDKAARTVVLRSR